MEEEKRDSLVNKPKLEVDVLVFAAISYLSVLFIIPWIIKRDNAYVMFHVRQGVALFLAELIVWFVLWLLEALLTTLFSFGAYSFMAFLYQVAWLVFTAVSLVGVYFAVKGIKRDLPIIGAIAKNFRI